MSPGSPPRTWDVVIVGGGIVGAGAPAGCRLPRDDAPRLSSRTTSPSAPRRGHPGSSMAACGISSSSTSGSCARRSPNGAACCERAPSRLARAAAVPGLRDPVPAQGVLRRRTDPVRPPRGAARRWLAPAARRAETLEIAPPLRRRPSRRPALPRRDGGRRPIHAGGPEDRACRRGGSPRGDACPGDGGRQRSDHRCAARPPRARPARGRRGRCPYARRGRCDRRLGGRVRAIRSRARRCGSGPVGAPTSSCRGERIPATAGLTIRVPGKVVFLVPWPDHWLIGTTDAPYDGPADRPSASRREIDELLATVNATLDVGARAGRRGRHVRRSAAAHRAVRRVDREGVARAPGDGRDRTASSASPAASTRRTGSWRATSSMPSWADEGARAPTERYGRSAAHRRGRPARPRTSPPRSQASRRRRRRIRRRRLGSSPGTAPRLRPSSRSARDSICFSRSCRADRSSRPRSPGPSATSSPCRSTTSCLDGSG